MKRKTPFILLIALMAAGSFACSKAPLLSKAQSPEEAYLECRQYSEDGDQDQAIQCFELLKSRFGENHETFQTDLEIADSYFRKKEFLSAADTYLAFLKKYPTHEKTGYAYYKIGLSYLRESPKAVDRDQQYLESSVRYFEIAAERTTGDLRAVSEEKLKEARTRIAKRHFYVGRFYHRTGEYLSAIPRFQEVVTTYAGLGLDEKALYLMGDSFLKLRQKEKALDILSVLEKHFPESPLKGKLARKIGIH